MSVPTGTPVVTLGFTREELEEMEIRAYPDAIVTWIQGLITATLAGEVPYEHPQADEPEGDAARDPGHIFCDGCHSEP